MALNPNTLSPDEERAPLLFVEENGIKTESADDDPLTGEDDGTAAKKAFWPEAKRALSLAVPISLSEVVSFVAYLITTAQVGRLGPLELSALTLARSIFHITGLSLVVGVSSAVDTFCGQAFGARQFQLLGLILQRAVLLCLITCMAPLVLWLLGAEWVMLRLLGQQPEVAALAGPYLRLLGPALGLWAVGCCIRNYFISQNVVAPQTVVACICTAATALVNHVFMFQFKLGILGAAVAYNLLQALELVMLVGAMAWLHHFRQAPGSRTWGGFSTHAFRGWGEYMKIALPSAAAICLDWWTYEAVILIAGLLPDANVQLGAMGLAFDTHALLFMLVDGFSSAAGTRVSNELGAGRGGCARYASMVALALGLVAPLGASVGLLAAPQQWAALFTENPHIIALVVSLMPVVTVSSVTDSVVSVSSGVLRGSGRQELAFRANLGVYWFMGLPLAALLALRYRMGALGLWLAMGSASALQAVVLLGCILRFDWPAEARKALRRVAESGADLLAALTDVEAAAAAEQPAPAAAEPAAAGRGEAAAESGGDVAVSQRLSCEGPAPVRHSSLHAGLGSRHGVHEPLLAAQHQD